MFTLYEIDFTPARKPYRIRLLFTHNIFSITEPAKLPRVISKLESHIWDKCSHYAG